MGSSKTFKLRITSPYSLCMALAIGSSSTTISSLTTAIPLLRVRHGRNRGDTEWTSTHKSQVWEFSEPESWTGRVFGLKILTKQNSAEQNPSYNYITEVSWPIYPRHAKSTTAHTAKKWLRSQIAPQTRQTKTSMFIKIKTVVKLKQNWKLKRNELTLHKNGVGWPIWMWCVKDGGWQSGVWKMVGDKVVCERWWVTMWCVKDGGWQCGVWKMVGDNVVCERWWVTMWCVKDGGWHWVTMWCVKDGGWQCGVWKMVGGNVVCERWWVTLGDNVVCERWWVTKWWVKLRRARRRRARRDTESKTRTPQKVIKVLNKWINIYIYKE